MADSKRVFILGAGFSKPANMPLATELLPKLKKRLQVDEHDGMSQWLACLQERVARLKGHDPQQSSFRLSIEEVFHYGQFDVEVYRLKQQLEDVGRGDGPGTPWRQAEWVEHWLSTLGSTLTEVILACEDECKLAPIVRWAKAVNPHDAVLTFNYDTLVERGLEKDSKRWNHGMRCEKREGIPVYKLHGSIDWIIADRNDPPPEWDLLFDKPNVNRPDRSTPDDQDDLLPDDGRPFHVEDDCLLWRRRTREQLQKGIRGRDIAWLARGSSYFPTIGIAGLGPYKQLHMVPGLGEVWARGMRALGEADQAVVVGFSMSDFDAMAQLQFADVALTRERKNRPPLHVVVIDPCMDDAGKARFERVFRSVQFIKEEHQDFDWSSLG